MAKKEDTEALEDMVPFYVNGTLDLSDKADFENALSVSEELRRAVAAERDLQSKVRSSVNSELDATNGTEPTRIQSLMGTSSAPGTGPEPSGLASALSFLNPTNWKPAMTLALAAAAVGQAVIIGGQSNRIGEQDTQIANLEADNYALASGGADCDAEATIMVELAEDANWSAIVALLKDERLLIERGTSQGILLLRNASESAEIDPVLERLNASPLIASASKAA